MDKLYFGIVMLAALTLESNLALADPPPFDKCAATMTFVRQQRESEADAAANIGAALLEAQAKVEQLQKELAAERAKPGK